MYAPSIATPLLKASCGSKFTLSRSSWGSWYLRCWIASRVPSSCALAAVQTQSAMQITAKRAEIEIRMFSVTHTVEEHRIGDDLHAAVWLWELEAAHQIEHA